MGFADGHVAGVVDDSLVAPKSAGLSKTAREAAWNIGNGVIIAKTAEDGVVGRQVVVHTDVKLRFIEAADGLAYKVVCRSGIVGVWQGIQIHQGRTEGVNQSGGYFGAIDAGNLAAVRIDGGGRTTGTASALKRGTARIGVGDGSGGNRSPEGVGAEVRVGLRRASVHRGAGD